MTRGAPRGSLWDVFNVETGMDAKQLQELYARRPFKARDAKTGEVVGFNTLVDLRDAISDGHVVRIDQAGQPDPSRNYERLTTDQIRQMCQVRNVRGFLTMNREQQIESLRVLDARDDAELLKARNAGGKRDKSENERTP